MIYYYYDGMHSNVIFIWNKLDEKDKQYHHAWCLSSSRITNTTTTEDTNIDPRAQNAPLLLTKGYLSCTKCALNLTSFSNTRSSTTISTMNAFECINPWCAFLPLVDSCTILSKKDRKIHIWFQIDTRIYITCKRAVRGHTAGDVILQNTALCGVGCYPYASPYFLLESESKHWIIRVFHL